MPFTTVDDAARTDDKRDARSAGALLRAAREHQGMHIATLAAAIKVAPRKLEALEQDRWDELPGPTFTRALAQAVCRALKADAAPIMELLPPADTSMLDSNFGDINEPFAGRGGRELGLAAWLPRGPLLIAAIVLLAAAALVMWLPAGTWGRLVGAAGAGVSAGGAETGTTTITVPAPTQAAPATGGTAKSPAPAPGSTMTAPATGSAAPATPGAAAASTAAAPIDSGSVTTTPLPAGALILQCTARSWIEVVDARGRVLLSRNLEAGESLGLDGLAPLQIVVGNVPGTQVTYKGQPVELESRARDNVARFELR